MGFFSRRKKNSSDAKKTSETWQTLSKLEEVELIMEASNQKPQLIYKHSHTCGTCLFAKREIEARADTLQNQADLLFVNVKQARPVSNGFAEKLQVQHESPQVLIVDKGEVVWHASHGAIKGDKIVEVLKGES